MWSAGAFPFRFKALKAASTPEQVAEDVHQRVRTLAPGGGFVFQQIHNIMANVPPENIVAMLEAVNSS